jgi:hypothetical protein
MPRVSAVVSSFLDVYSFVVAISDDCNRRKQRKEGDRAGLRSTVQRKRSQSTNMEDNQIL